MKVLFLAFFLSAIAIADSDKQCIEQLNQVQNKVSQLLNPQNLDCNEFDACEDLYGATCLDKDGNFKKDFNLDEETQFHIEEAQQVAAEALGKENIFEAYFDFLKSNGFEIKDELTDDQRDELLKNKDISNLESYFKGFEQCRLEQVDTSSLKNPEAEGKTLFYFQSVKESKEKFVQYYADYLEKNQNSSIASSIQEKYKQAQDELIVATKDYEEVKKLKGEYNTKLSQLYSSKNSELIQSIDTKMKGLKSFYAQNMSIFYSDLVRNCSNAPNTLSMTKEKINRDVEASQSSPMKYIMNPILNNLNFDRVCNKRNIYQIKSLLVNVERFDDQKKKKIVSEILDANFKDVIEMQNFSHSYFSAISENSLNTNEQTDFSKLSSESFALCETNKDVYKKQYVKLYDQFLGNVAKSRPVVEWVVKNAFSADKKVIVDKVFNQSKKLIAEMLKDFNIPGPKLKIILEQYQKMSYFWASSPSNSLFTKDKDFALPVLDFYNFSPYDSGFYLFFMDPTLSSLNEINAYYEPRTQNGVEVKNETINLNPAVNFYAQKDPIGVMMVIAHELGHKIGPKVSKLNGHDLRGNYQVLLDCLKSKSSIKMSDFQEDEVFADWVSANVLGKYIASLPEKERKKAVLNISSFFCEMGHKTFYTDEEIKSKFDSHPLEILRVNGIFGSNTLIRNALGCKQDSTFKECKLGNKK
ncbi:MAG: hypothetical protein AB7I27_00910 [Bacteriovoracaceae bacterium]